MELQPLVLIDVPHVRQKTKYTCGPAALLSIAKFLGRDISEEDLSQEATPEDGLPPAKLLEVANTVDLQGHLETGWTVDKLKEAIKLGLPTIIAIQAWNEAVTNYSNEWMDGHYVVAIGFDQDHLIVEDPGLDTGRGLIPWSQLMTRWHDQDSNGRRYYQLAMIFEDTRLFSEQEIIACVADLLE